MNLLPYADHPNMTVAQFDAAVDRAHRNNLRVTDVVRGIAFVTSASKPGRVHRVTRTTCDCEGHRQYRRCMHRAFAIFLADMMGGFGQSKPLAPVTFIHTRRVATTEQPVPAA